jgi:hypothetical protein
MLLAIIKPTLLLLLEIEPATNTNRMIASPDLSNPHPGHFNNLLNLSAGYQVMNNACERIVIQYIDYVSKEFISFS